MSASTQNGLYLMTSDGALEYGPKYVPVYDLPSEDGTYTQAKMGGTESIFVVYRSTNMSTAANGEEAGIIVDSTSYKSVGFTIRSFQGFDKDGLILFEHSNYAGNGVNYRESDANIGASFPASGPKGVSSFLVYKGIWELYIQPNFQGGKIKVNGKDRFGPGTIVQFVGKSVNDKVLSVKKVQD